MRAPLRPLSVLALVGVAAAVPAFAQTAAPPVSQYPACSGQPSQADTNAAHGAYMAGKGSFDEADYGRAIDYFKDAYRRDCTKPELLVIIARAYELKGDRREAVNALETYVARAPNAPDAETQKRHIANLKKEIAEAPAGSAAPSASATTPTATAPSATAPSATPAPSASTAAPETTPSTSTTSPSRSSSIAPWIVVGAGGAMAVTGGVLFGVGAGKVSSAESACPNHVCPAGPGAQANADKGNSGRSLETVGVVLGGVGLGAVAGGLLWYFLGQRGPSSAPQTGHAVITPQVAPGYAGALVGGRF